MSFKGFKGLVLAQKVFFGVNLYLTKYIAVY